MQEHDALCHPRDELVRTMERESMSAATFDELLGAFDAEQE
jgi:hypothetical protein